MSSSPCTPFRGSSSPVSRCPRFRLKPSRRSILEPYTTDLARRWQDGCRNAAVLWQELRAAGFRESYTTVCAYLAPFRDQPLPPVQRPLAVRTIVALLIRRPETLEPQAQHQLATLCEQSAELATVRTLTHAFATLLHE